MSKEISDVGFAERVSASRLLLADLLDWHERDEKPEWWLYFERANTMQVADFIEDSECIGGLERVRVDEWDGKPVVVYRFPVDQEYKIKQGSDRLVCPARLCSLASGPLPVYKTKEKKGQSKNFLENLEVIWIDEEKGMLALDIPHESADPMVLMEAGPLDSQTMQNALQRVAKVALGEASDGARFQYSSVFSLLEGRAPRFRSGVSLQRGDHETSSDVFIRIAPHLDSSCMAVQGPPGAGKTYSLARAALECVLNGMKVGICAFKHTTLETVAREIQSAISDSKVDWGRRLSKAGISLQMQKQQKSGATADPSEPWSWADKPATFLKRIREDECRISLATHFWFSRPELDEVFDIVFIDEAGQLSLANTLAAATSAKSLVLVGDPQQLSQPSKGSHPVLPEPFDQVFPRGSGASALEHILGNDKTIHPDRGILLDQTWRMRPEICDFLSETMYDGLLESAPKCSDRWVRDGQGTSEVGMRWLAVDHEGNKTSSDEEVDVIVELVQELRRFTITDEEGTRPVGPDDMMILAPYNSQVNSLASRLVGYSVGTVDKFQGEEAGIVIVSMTASSAEDVPRGMEFLYSANRLNVAISRARALCIVVGSPTLLSARCNTVEQMKLANMLCRLAETASPW